MSLFLVLSAAFSGCATISSDYTPEPLDVFKQSSSTNQDISFSVDLINEVGRFRVPNLDKDDIVSVVKERLKETGHYKKIFYAPFNKKWDTHFHFQVVITGTKGHEAETLGVMSGLLTLMTIPVFLDYYSDLSVFVIENNHETFSASATEKIHKTLWLPLVVISPLFNDYVTGNRVINKQVSYLISEIVNNH